MLTISNKPAIVRPAEEQETRIKKLHAAIEAGDKDNFKKAVELGGLLIVERKKYPPRSGWLKRLGR